MRVYMNRINLEFFLNLWCFPYDGRCVDGWAGGETLIRPKNTQTLIEICVG